MRIHLAPVVLIAFRFVTAADFVPPRTQASPVIDILHGVRVTDPNRWLEDQSSPDTRAWLAAQERFARGYLDSIPGRDGIRRTLESLLKVDSVSTPSVRNGRYFFSRRRPDEDRNSLCMRQGFSGKEEVLVDPKTADDDPTTAVQYLRISDDGNLILFGTRHGGEDETDARLLDVATRKVLPDRLPRARYFGFSLRPDKKGLYYTRFTKEQGARIYYHAIGSEAADRQIFGDGYGPAKLMRARLSDSGRWLLIEINEGVPPKYTEIYVQDVANGGPIQTVVKEAAEFEPHFAGDSLVLNSNSQAPNRRIFRVDLKNPARDRWKEIVPESKQAIQGVSAAGGRLFVNYLDNVMSRVRQFDLDGKSLGDLKLPGIGSVFGPDGRWSDDEAFLSFTSFAEPVTSYRLMVSTGKQDIWFRPNVPVKPGEIEVKQVWYTSKDGTKVPMFLVQPKGLSLDADRPVLLNGYGGFNVAEVPVFNPSAVWWTAHGGVYAVANLRGGGEFGESWHRAGMYEKKQNVFDDFIAAAEWLTANQYTRPAKLAIRGGSNGGLLMGAMMTQRPELFGVIVCRNPLLDMLRYHKMLVGGWWTAEYGSADDPKQFEYLYKYSPYHNVKQGTKYPSILFVSGDSDTRVDPSHARKMTALVQAANASENPIMLRYDIKGGHIAIDALVN